MSVKVWDTTAFQGQGGNVNVSAEAAQEGYKSGRYKLIKGQTVDLINGAGRHTTVQAGEVNRALRDPNASWRMAGSAEIADHEAQNQQMRTFGEGMVRGLLPGLADPLMESFTTSTMPSQIRHQQEESRVGRGARLRENPGMALTGEIAGNIAGAFMGPATPAGLALRAGAAIERAVVREVGELGARGLSQKAAGMAAGGATEGLLLGTGEAVTEANLGNHDLTAERLLHHATMGAFFGGAAGAAMPGLGAAARGVGRVPGRIANQVWERGSGMLGSKKLGKGLMDQAHQATQALDKLVVSKDSKEFAKQLTALTPEGKKMRKAAFEHKATVDTHARGLSDDLNELEARSRRIQKQGVGQLKRKQVIADVNAGEGMDQLHAAQQQLSGIRNIAKKLKQSPLLAGGTTKPNQLMKLVNESRKELNRFADRFTRKGQSMKGLQEMNGETFIILDRLKQQLGKMGNFNPGFGKTATSAETNIQEQYFNLKNLLENEGMWGKPAVAQKEVNQAWHSYLNENKLYNRGFVDLGAKGEFKVTAKKVRGYLNGLKDVRSDELHKSLRNRLNGQQNVVDQISKHYDMTPELLSEAAGVTAQTKRMNGRLKAVEEEVVLGNQLADLQAEGNKGILEAFGISGKGIGAIAAGGLIGGPVGAAAAVAVNIASKPALRAQLIYRLENANTKAVMHTATQVKSIFQKGKAAVTAKAQAVSRVAGKRTLARTTLALSAASTPGERQEAAHKKIEELKKFRDNPMETHKKLTEMGNSTRDLAPNITGVMQSKMAAALGVEFDAIPPGSDTLRPLRRGHKQFLSATEIKQFADIVLAVEDPMSVPERIAEQTLTKEAFTAYANAFPSESAELVQMILTGMAEAEEAPGYSTELYLSRLLGMTLTPSLDPVNMTQLAELGTGEEGPVEESSGPAQGGQAPRKPLSGKKSVSHLALNPTTSVLNRDALS